MGHLGARLDWQPPPAHVLDREPNSRDLWRPPTKILSGPEVVQAVSALGGMCEATAEMNELAWRGIGRGMEHVSKYEHDAEDEVHSIRA